jgi:hypothetical protein
MYEPRLREPDDKIHKLRVKSTRGRHLVDLTPLWHCS